MASQHKGVVSPIKVPEHDKLRISFEYYDSSCNDYCLSKWDQNQIRTAVLRLKDLCTKSFHELRSGRSVYHFGEVYWDRTTKPMGFPEKKVNELPAFHFGLLGINHQKARVFGAYQAGTFYVVWFDLDHQIWPSLLKHT